MEKVEMYATIYVRRNGALGSSCNGTQDTGHHITKDSAGRFTVYSVDDPDVVLVKNASRSEAERTIAVDWLETEVKQSRTGRRR